MSRRPKLGVFEGSIKGEVGNFDTRRMSATLNIPLVDDVLAVRLAGSMTARDGFDYNSITKNRVNGRDLWSGRVSARRSEEHTSELQSLMRISYAVFCLKTKTKLQSTIHNTK